MTEAQALAELKRIQEEAREHRFVFPVLPPDGEEALAEYLKNNPIHGA
jgi:hypothetical protein